MSYTIGSFNVVLSFAVKNQSAANTYWHEAFKQAVTLAGDMNRNLSPLNALLKAVHGSKSLTIMPLVKCVLHLGGGSFENQDKGMIIWNAKELKFSVRKDKEMKGRLVIEPAMVAKAIAMPWWEIAPKENVVQFASFANLTSALRSLKAKDEKGEAFLSAEEKATLAAIEQLIVNKLGRDAMEAKKGKVAKK